MGSAAVMGVGEIFGREMPSISVRPSGVFKSAGQEPVGKIYVMRIDPDGTPAWETIQTNGGGVKDAKVGENLD